MEYDPSVVIVVDATASATATASRCCWCNCNCYLQSLQHPRRVVDYGVVVEEVIDYVVVVDDLYLQHPRVGLLTIPSFYK